MDASRRFGGIARLYGAQPLSRFGQAHVAVVGVGGVGSWAVEALARSGIGRLSLYDLDHVAESNVNRQLPALESQFGRAKVRVLAERVGEINPVCQVMQHETFIELDNLELLAESGLDYVVDCIDSYRVKAAMINFCRRYKLKIVTVGGAGGRTDPTRIQIADLSRTVEDPLLSRTRRQLRKEYGFPSDAKQRFSVPAVFSTEPLRYPAKDGAVCLHKSPVEGSLHCGGFGSAMTVTAGFALAAVSQVLKRLADEATV